MRDSARVFLLTDNDTPWQMLATNNSFLGAELPQYISVSADASNHPNQRIQELFDNTGGWRQARIDLSEFAGQTDLQLRFDFHTAGDTGRGLPGDEFGNFNHPQRGQDNAYEGFYVDDIIIGFAERGEMVTGPSDLADYFQVPQNPDPSAPAENLTGPYQLEIRRGTEYGAVLAYDDPQIAIFDTYDTNDRLIREMSRLGDRNVERPQDQLQVYANTITDSGEYGILVAAGQRDAGSALPHPGSVRNLPTLNGNRLAGGVNIVNNIIADSATAGIYFGGDPNTGGVPDAVIPFGRIVNNTIYGGDEPSGFGIRVADNASPTILNNVLANNATAISVDDTSGSTVAGGNLFQNNNNSDLTGAFSISLNPGDPLFVNAAAGNFYLAPGSRAIDSSIDSLEDRPGFVAVKSPLRIPPSPILAPEVDHYGQLRTDDPAQNPPPGMGFNVFKDRGAVEAPVPDIDVELPGQADKVASFDFGPVQAGQSISQTFTVRNEGMASLVVSEASGLVEPFSLVPVNEMGNAADDWTILAGETMTFDVTFAPTSAGEYDGASTLVSNDPDETSYALTITGTAVNVGGDLNDDGFVGQSDLDIVLAMWGRSHAEIADPRADVNEDDFVGQTDLDYVLADWGWGTPPTALALTAEVVRIPASVSEISSLTVAAQEAGTASFEAPRPARRMRRGGLGPAATRSASRNELPGPGWQLRTELAVVSRSGKQVWRQLGQEAVMPGGRVDVLADSSSREAGQNSGRRADEEWIEAREESSVSLWLIRLRQTRRKTVKQTSRRMPLWSIILHPDLMGLADELASDPANILDILAIASQ